MMQTPRALMRTTSIALLLAVCAGTGSAQTSDNTLQPIDLPSHNLRGAITDSARLFTPAPLPPRQMSRRKAIVLGVVIGGAVGATAGYFIAHDSCDTCDDSAPVALVTAAAGIGGALLGGFVAAQNSPPGPSQSSLRTTSTQFLAIPRPVVRYHLATFR